MGFFEWVREGVRQAVVLGLADAIEDVGTRSRDDDLGATLATSLRDKLTTARPTSVVESATTASGRKRLGRSLEGIRKAA